MTEPVPEQQTFDRVARHLRRQGRPFIRVSSPHGAAYGGAYRGVDGCMCSAGCLIPDQLYDPGMEGRCVSDDQPAGVALMGLGHSLPLVQQLQLLHDGLIETWSHVGISTGLRELALSFGLDPGAATGPL